MEREMVMNEIPKQRSTGYEIDLDNIFTYHAPKGDQAERYVKLREAAKEYAKVVLALCPSSSERTKAIGLLDQANMLANASIARHE